MENGIDVLIIRPGEKPERARIGNTLDALQRIVGGYVEAITLMDGSVLYCNEEGRAAGLPVNRVLASGELAGGVIGGPAVAVAGVFVVCGFDAGSGDNVGLAPDRLGFWGVRFALGD